METKIFKTACQEEREARDMEIYNEYNDLMSAKGQSKTVVIKHLMNKHNIHSTGTIYIILHRVKARLNGGRS